MLEIVSNTVAEPGALANSYFSFDIAELHLPNKNHLLLKLATRIVLGTDLVVEV